MPERYACREAAPWLHWLIELVALAALLVPAWYLLQVWPSLPDSVPTHFNAAGVPDAFGNKSTLWLLMLVQVALGQAQGIPAWPRILSFQGIFPVIIWMMVAVQRTPATTR